MHTPTHSPHDKKHPASATPCHYAFKGQISIQHLCCRQPGSGQIKHRLRRFSIKEGKLWLIGGTHLSGPANGSAKAEKPDAWRVELATPVAPNTDYTITGTLNAATGTLSLYLNGQPADSKTGAARLNHNPYAPRSPPWLASVQ